MVRRGKAKHGKASHDCLILGVVDYVKNLQSRCRKLS